MAAEDGLPQRPPPLSDTLRLIGAAYQGSVTRNGATPGGVGWSSRRAQELRLRTLLRIFDGLPAPTASVADIGCGYGALWPLLAEQTAPRITDYTGYDIVPAMVRLGRKAFGADPRVRFLLGQVPDEVVDYGFVSGTFNYRGEVPNEAWKAQVSAALRAIGERCRHGLAFNLLHRRGGKSLKQMYYTTPEAWTGMAQAMARGGMVSVVDDYLPDDFTIFVHFGADD